MVKIFRKMKAKHLPQTDRHIRIARKIKIDLKGKRHCSQPRQRHAHIRAAKPFDLIPEYTDLIRQQHFFCQTEQKPLQAMGDTKSCRLPRVHLFLHILITHNRSRDQLWKQAHIHSKRNDIVLRHRLSPVHINRVGHRLERIKRDTDRQCKLQKPKLRTRHLIQRPDGKIRILKKA